jgi:hypothetical protein
VAPLLREIVHVTHELRAQHTDGALVAAVGVLANLVLVLGP